VLATGQSVPGFDPEDIFGVRRALRSLPEDLWDDFLAEWAELGERMDCDVDAVRQAARDEARAEARSGRERLRSAWSTVASAMGAYLEWRDGLGDSRLSLS
jgi:hypothetical protein